MNEIYKDILRKQTPYRSVIPNYPKFSVTATIVCIHPMMIFDPEKYFLVGFRSDKCDTEPDKWCFPGGFLEPGETLRECAARELKEELGLIVPIIDDLYPIDEFSRPGIDPRGQVINVVFAWKIKDPDLFKAMKASEEMSSWDWKTAKELSEIPMAFNHNEIVEKILNG